MGQLDTGWYTDDEGNKRYWDGSQWLSKSSEDGRQKEPKKTLRKSIIVALSILLLLVGGGIGWKLWSDYRAEEEKKLAGQAFDDIAKRAADDREAAQRKAREAQARAEADKAEKERQIIEAWSGDDWYHVENLVFYKEVSTQCSNYRHCVELAVASPNKCESGISVTMQFLSDPDEVLLDTVTRSTGSTDASQAAMLEFMSFTDYESVLFDVTKASCR